MQITIDKKDTPKLLAVAAVAILFLIFLINDAHWFWVEAWFLIEIALITSFTRTVSLRSGINMLLLGIFMGFGVVYILGSMFDAVGMSDAIRSFLMPPLEEIAKLLPLLVAFYAFGSWKRPRLNLSDFIFLGTCAGAGFSMLEKYFWGNVHFPFTYGPHVGDIYLFSDALGVYAGGGQFGYIGHAAASLFVALGLGLTYQMLAKKKKFWLAPVLIAFAWVSVEHIILNYYYTPQGEALMLFGGGMWTPWIILVAIIAALACDAAKLNKLLSTNAKLKAKLGSAFKHIKDPISFFRAWSVLRGINYLAWVKHN